MKKTMFLFLLLWLSASALVAQGLAASGAQSGDAVVPLTLGQSVVALYGPWKFNVGDSPMDPKTGEPLWAEPDYDDSKWEDVDLTPKEGALDPFTGVSGYVPGWTAQGHPGYWGYAWYRIRVRVHPTSGQGLALEGSEDVDDAYQVFANGELQGSFGDFAGSKPIVYSTTPAMFPIIQRGTETAEVLAFRFWMQPSTLVQNDGAGGMHTAPLLGERSVVALHYKSKFVDLIRRFLSTSIETVALLLLSIVAFSLIFFDRSDRAYLWMGALFLTTAAERFAAVLSNLTTVISLNEYNLLEAVLFPFSCALCTMVWWVWFGRIGSRRIPYLVAVLTVLMIISRTFGYEVFYGIIPHAVASRFNILDIVIRILWFGLLVKIAVDAIRHRGLDGWLFVPILLLRGITWFYLELSSVFHIRVYYYPFGVWISPGLITRFLEAVLISFLLLRRLLQSVNDQKEMALDVRQAQEVQQVILPHAITKVPGLMIESEYRPAREVGGDFFQIIPHKSDGSVLVVAGDVTGKGLKAGMLVALLVGAIQNASETTAEPLEILRALNRTLLRRGDAQATCLALRVANDGSVTLANAGHVPPYLNAEPLQMEGALPLGMIEAPDFSQMRFRLAENDHLILLSDGIVEATDAKGNLFGFERIKELLCRATSAAELATAAQNFGQDDDITVLSLVRVGVKEQPFTFKTDTLSTASG